MTTFYAATVTIGRNVTVEKTLPERPGYYEETTVKVAEPMSPIRWAGFRASVRRLLLTAGLQVTAQNQGHGSWDGVEEENCVFVALFDATTPAAALRENFSREVRGLMTVAEDESGLASLTENDLAAGLGELKVQYKQEAIAFAWGPSRLV